MESGTHPSDGSIDFSQYSLEQLEELRLTINRDTFPRNYANLLAQIERLRTPAAPSPAAENAFDGKFTPRKGLWGWIQAKRRWSPVYGTGALEITSTDIALRGWQRTWLGVPIRAEVTHALDSVRNVAAENEWVRFEITRKFLPARQIEFLAESANHAQKLVAQLPTTQDARFEKRWPELRDYNRRLTDVSGRPWVTPALVLANLAVFAAMAISAGQPGAFDPQMLLRWGANFGPYTVNGQWWRLFSALFVHLNLAHVLLNMWALWNVGRLSERLYGRWTFSFLYFGTGAIASLTSIAWDPSLSSAGASGAIFGIFGAFVAFLVNRRNRVPLSIARAHWVSTVAFVLFNLISGALQDGIDNAAHVGGLLGGLALGAILARPLDIELRRGFTIGRSTAAVAFVAMIVAAVVWHARGTGLQLNASERFAREHVWYMNGETENLRKWQELANRTASGAISPAELSERFEKEILPFWKTAHARLQKEMRSSAQEKLPMTAAVAEFARLRLDWSHAIVEATRDRDETRMREMVRLMGETGKSQARLDRLGLRARMDHRPRALKSSRPVQKIRALLPWNHWTCVRAPEWYGPGVAATDAKDDGPAARDAAACLAQRLFLTGNYEELDARLKRATASRADLPDGGSTVDALYGGLSNLFSYGSMQVEDALGRVADWRHAVEGSVEPDLVEVMLFQEWAWAARGTGTAKTVSPQAWATFGHHTEMAAAGLRELEDEASDNPVWYELSLGVGLDQSLETEQLRATFDKGIALFPEYWPLHRAMLRILMPRWGGSFAKIDALINDVSNSGGEERDFAKYARLYWAYDSLERDEINIFEDARAHWPTVKRGFEELLERYPKSDYVLNRYARLACLAEDAETYAALRPLIEARPSATAWSEKVDIAGCDKKMDKTNANHGDSHESADAARM